VAPIYVSLEHLCAEMAAMLGPARAFVWYTAHTQVRCLTRRACLPANAKAHLHEVSRMASEVHGGMGFTHELGLHYWFKRISASRQLLGAASAVAGKPPRSRVGVRREPGGPE
jgi:alkylation response protein AidB-like acyl-CoA dehydrogenase